MNRRLVVLFLCTTFLFVSCAPPPPPPAPVPTTMANVRLDKQLDSDTSRYRVEGATGPDQGTASDQAAVLALAYAAKSLAGDPREKTSAGNYIKNHLMAVMPYAAKGQIYRRSFSASGDQMVLSMYIKINRSDLQRHLTEQQVITASRRISKAVGKPKIMVIYEQADCARGKGQGELCTLPAQINKQAKLVAAEEAKVAKFQKTILDAGCLDKTEDKEETEASTSDKSTADTKSASKGRHSSSSSRSGSISGSRAGTTGSLSGRSSGSSSASGSHDRSSSSQIRTNREANYKNFRSSVRASPNCRNFLNRLTPLERRVDMAQIKLDDVQNRMDSIRSKLQKRDVATVKINEWFVNQRWEVVDDNAVRKAQRLMDSMMNVKGLAEDPVARLAQLAGADIYVMHNTNESRAGGGYQVHLDVRAYEVVSGKMLGSKVGKSRNMASEELHNATSEAVGRAMPKVLDQMTAYWSDMMREGVKCKLVLRGDFNSSKARRKANRALRDLSEVIGDRKCKNQCEWQKGLSTTATISGEFTSPAKVRRNVGDYLEEALDEAGFRINLVVSNQAVTIFEVM